MSQSSCSAKEVQVSVVACTDLLPILWLEVLSTNNTNLKQCDSFQNFICQYVPEVTDSNNLLSATGSESNDNHRQDFVTGTIKHSPIYSRYDNLTSLAQMKGITLLIGVQNLS